MVQARDPVLEEDTTYFCQIDVAKTILRMHAFQRATILRKKSNIPIAKKVMKLFQELNKIAISEWFSMKFSRLFISDCLPFAF